MLFITLDNVLIGSSHGPTNPLTDRAKRANRLTRAPTRDEAHVRTIKPIDPVRPRPARLNHFSVCSIILQFCLVSSLQYQPFCYSDQPFF
jgi:hypothetical protein